MVPHTVIAKRQQAVKAAGLHPVVVDVERQALWNAYWALVGASQSAQTALLMNVGAKTTNLVIAKGPDDLVLVRDLQLGARAIEEGRQAEWVTEVSDSLGYASSQAGLRQLDAAYVTGGGSGTHLIPLLKPVVPSPVALWNPLKQLVRDGESAAVEESAGPLLAVAIGLALRQSI